MEEKNDMLGEIFVNGRIINLDKVSIEDLERYITELEKAKTLAISKFDKLVEEISNN